MTNSVEVGTTDLVTPLWFGPEASRLLGWYHAPHGDVINGAVLLCPPFGHEYLVSYRSYRKLAEVLALAGMACLFFDYDGTGDSAESELPRVQAWRESIVLAAKELRQISGATSVSLFGVRLGALLAASVAADISANALVMLAPVVAGRAFVREQLGFARMSPLAASEASRQKLTEEEVVGYPFAISTQHDLSALDMLKMDCRCPSLVVERDDMPGQINKLLNGWRAQEREIQLSQSTGYAAMMTDDAHSSTPPIEIWEEVRDWLLGRQFAAASPPFAPVELPASMQYGQLYQEEVLVFNGLAGVITSPLGKLPRKTGVVLTNIGTSHRVGNHLLHVHLARSLAHAGYAVIRFDRAGTGYSRATPGNVENDVYADSGIADVRAAMDCLQARCPCMQMVLAGLCSGAYFSYHAAVQDARVKGLILINLLTFEWHAGDSLEMRIRDSNKSTDFYLRSVFDLQTWSRLMKGEVAVWRITVALVGRLGVKLQMWARMVFARASGAAGHGGVVAQNFRELLKRRTKLFFVFGADDASQDVVAAELGRDACLLTSPRHIRIETIAHTDHTFTPLWSQAHLRDSIGRYMQKYFR